MNWKIELPLAQSYVEHTEEGIAPDHKMPLLHFDWGFIGGQTAHTTLTKTDLQTIFEQLEVCQIKLDELTQ